MKVVFASPEMVPFSKTGGLADVAGALPAAMGRRGHEIHAFTPYYRETVKRGFSPGKTVASVRVRAGAREFDVGVSTPGAAHDNVVVHFLECPELFDRSGLYQSGGADYPDNSTRFIVFSRALIEACEALDLSPDLLHLNDWQTALVPAYLRTVLSGTAAARAATLLTIHNLAHQGLFWHFDWELTGLPGELFDWRKLEFWGRINFLKGGIVYSDCINTVSRTYASEILGPEMGCGLEAALRERKDDLFGVVNGIDSDAWNPMSDSFIAARYGPDAFGGKAACKGALREEAGLDWGDLPLFGMITRLAPQKGVDLVLDRIDEIVDSGAQLVVLGEGLPEYHARLLAAQAKHPGRVRAFLKFDDALSHRIEAGCDAFLMPSRYEPCGLNQLMSLRYGTVPVVRRTGGLADTVVPATAGTISDGTATGVGFDSPDADSLLDAVRRTVDLYNDHPLWRRIAIRGMREDWSWDRSAAEYEKLWELAIEKKSGR